MAVAVWMGSLLHRNPLAGQTLEMECRAVSDMVARIDVLQL
jgi:hypothetical protein